MRKRLRKKKKKYRKIINGLYSLINRYTSTHEVSFFPHSPKAKQTTHI